MAFNDDDRVVLKLPMVDVETDAENDNCVEIHKALLRHAGNLAMRTDLMDMGVYVFSYWVLEHLRESENITKFTSIQADLIPFLIKRQYQPSETILEEIPAIRNRQRSLASLEPWLIANNSAPIDRADGKHFELIDFLVAEKEKTETFTGGVSTCLIPDVEGGRGSERGVGRVDASISNQSLDNADNSHTISSTHGHIKATRLLAGNPMNDYTTTDIVSVRDVLRCYAWFYEEPEYEQMKTSTSNLEVANTFIPSALNTSPVNSNDIASGPCLMLRLLSVNSYICLNKELPNDVYVKDITPWYVTRM